MHMINLLQNRVNQLELKLDDIEQEGRSDSLLFNGVKQIPSQSVGDTMKRVLFVKMGLTNIKDSDIVSVQRFRVGTNNAQRPDKVAPVLVQFRSKEIARHVFKAKKQLSGSGLFVAENLTKHKRNLMSASRDKFGNRSVWSDQGRIFVRETDTPPSGVSGQLMTFYRVFFNICVFFILFFFLSLSFFSSAISCSFI